MKEVVYNYKYNIIMKKIILLVLLAVSFSFVNAGLNVNGGTTVITTNVCPETYTVDVFMIKGRTIVSVTRKKGTFDSEENKLYVDGGAYRVSYNSAYGKDGKRGAYQYVANGCYYFNL